MVSLQVHGYAGRILNLGDVMNEEEVPMSQVRSEAAAFAVVAIGGIVALFVCFVVILILI
jgi:hypothetical protein